MDYIALLQRELVVAMGCTEPAAVALAAAAASKALGADLPRKIQLFVSAYIAKNGMHVGIPGTPGLSGLPIAAAMGVVGKNPEQGLNLICGLTPAQVREAQDLLPCISVAVKPAAPKVYAEVALSNDEGQVARCVISDRHDHIHLLAFDGAYLKAPVPCEQGTREAAEEPHMTFAGIYTFCREVDVARLDFLRRTIELNLEIAREGLEGEYGLGVGRGIVEDIRAGRLSDDDIHHMVALTAAAADARMSGSMRSVMSTAGSGNQGLTASVPVVALARRMGKSDEEMLRALALSELLTIHAKQYIGRLSVLCGCSIAAAIGVCAALVWLYGGGPRQMELAIGTLVADISGVVCDGAKPGCALKIATAIASAARAALLAMRDRGAGCRDGIVCETVEQTLSNLGRLGTQGMDGANGLILDMMMNKQVVK